MAHSRLGSRKGLSAVTLEEWRMALVPETSVVAFWL